jgi:hypothetical protein
MQQSPEIRENDGFMAFEEYMALAKYKERGSK